MKIKNLIPIIFITIGFLGLILLVFGSQFNGTLCDEIQKAGIAGLSIFGLWAIINLANNFATQKELENL